MKRGLEFVFKKAVAWNANAEVAEDYWKRAKKGGMPGAGLMMVKARVDGVVSRVVADAIAIRMMGGLKKDK